MFSLNSLQLSKKWPILILLAMPLFIAVPAHSAQQSLAEALQQQVDIEEIRVTAPKTLRAVRSQIERAEFVQNEIFNDLVEDKNLQILCEKVIKTGSHFRNRDCEPRFMKKARRKERFESQPFSNMIGPEMAVSGPSYAIGGMSNRQLTEQESGNYERLSQELIRLGTENQTLGNAILEAHKLRALYREITREKFWEERSKD